MVSSLQLGLSWTFLAAVNLHGSLSFVPPESPLEAVTFSA